eukprot:12089778-Ditylum_brightwellii.AAC.2
MEEQASTRKDMRQFMKYFEDKYNELKENNQATSHTSGYHQAIIKEQMMKVSDAIKPLALVAMAYKRTMEEAALPNIELAEVNSQLTQELHVYTECNS